MLRCHKLSLRSFCNDEISKNEASQKATEDTLADLEAELESLDADIDTLKKEIKTLTEQSHRVQSASSSHLSVLSMLKRSSNCLTYPETLEAESPCIMQVLGKTS